VLCFHVHLPTYLVIFTEYVFSKYVHESVGIVCVVYVSTRARVRGCVSCRYVEPGVGVPDNFMQEWLGLESPDKDSEEEDGVRQEEDEVCALGTVHGNQIRASTEKIDSETNKTSKRVKKMCVCDVCVVCVCRNRNRQNVRKCRNSFRSSRLVNINKI
jgi:hypothetical protein